MKKLSIFFILMLGSLLGIAQESKAVEMADGMRSSGKIYVVIASLLLIFLGIVYYLFRIEKRITKLEKEQK
jgi:CcmD family protein